jgi:ubiquinone/menaquinone biosynthesis C-methylase UbiE
MRSRGSCPRLARTTVSDPDGAGRAAPGPKEGKALKRVVKLWDEAASRRAGGNPEGWLDSPFVFREFFQTRVSGDPDMNWLEGLMARTGIAKGGAWASLGCGAAGEEIKAGSLGLWSALAAFDASQTSLDLGRRAAADAGLAGTTFAPIDLDRFTLPGGAFDVVLMNMSLHHVREIRAALEAIRGALRPGGFLILNEFVGPRQFQFPDTQVEAVRALLTALPERLRMDLTTSRPKSEYVRLPAAHWEVEDPSEAISSDLILPEVARLFEIVVRVDYGGTVLNPLLEHVVHNFDAADEKDAALLRLLAAAEALLIDSGVLTNDFIALAARPRGAVNDPAAPPRLAPPAPLRPLAPLSHASPEAERLAAELVAIRGSRGWRILQALRGLLGRRW